MNFVELNETLSSKSYLAGERFTIADAVYLPMFWRFGIMWRSAKVRESYSTNIQIYRVGTTV